MSFVTGTFLIALAAAAGPIIIHLLNRRRFRTIDWAAIDFLAQAVQRNKRMMEIRDIVLLTLRTLAIILFVLAMAQPYWLAEQGGNYQGGPVHAVLVIDNSLSMGYQQLDKTLLDQAKERAHNFVSTLPKGSQVSIIPLCQQNHWHFKDAYATKEDALEAIAQIQLVDRIAGSEAGADLAEDACARVVALPTKRVVFISDMQGSSWTPAQLKDDFEALGNVQVVSVGPAQRDNSWVASFALRDGIADAESMSVFDAVIRHSGSEPRLQARVSLSIDGDVVEERFVDLVPEQSMELIFKHKFTDHGTSRNPLFHAVRLELSADRLSADDSRTVVVPVVARTPVLFIDQHGEREQAGINRYGETYLLRRLLAPGGAHLSADRQLIEIRHRAADGLTQEDLAEARLVAIAGIAEPPEQLVDLLRDYMDQGGQIFIAGGAEFDAERWNAAAWRDGDGILPARLQDEPVGALPAPGADSWPKFGLDSTTFKDEIFAFNMTDAERDELLSSAYVYKAIGIDIEGMEKQQDAARKRFEERYAWLLDYETKERQWAEAARAGKLSSAMASDREAARKRYEEMRPSWLAWTNPLAGDMADMTIDQLLAQSRPRVMGSYTNGEAFAVRRKVGKGQVIMVTTGCYPSWNNIATQHSVLLYDRILRSMLTQSLPERTMGGINDLVIPVAARHQAASFSIAAPGDEAPVPIAVEATGKSSYGLILRSLGKRGTYRVERSADSATGEKAWNMLLAINGPSSESELTSIGKSEFMAGAAGERSLRWVGQDDAISLEGDALLGSNFWKYLILVTLLLLIAEMIFLLPSTTEWLRRRTTGGSADPYSNPAGGTAT
jgi:hypothetical protein